MLRSISSYFWPEVKQVENAKETGVIVKQMEVGKSTSVQGFVKSTSGQDSLSIEIKAASVQDFTSTEVKASLVEEVKKDPQAEYEKRVKEYKAATQDLSALFKHILWILDAKSCSSPTSIAKKIRAMGGSNADMKGLLIHLVNAGHRGSSCPFFKDTSLKPSLHLGTTRTWNGDGSINEARWQQLIDNAAEKNKTIVTLSKLQAYLAKCAANDPEDNEPDPAKRTGRHTFGPLSKEVQMEAAVLAWNEVFDRLACGWKTLDEHAGTQEPYITVGVLREFFDDSPLAYLRAECGLLPAPKPKMEVVAKPALVA